MYCDITVALTSCVSDLSVKVSGCQIDYCANASTLPSNIQGEGIALSTNTDQAICCLSICLTLFQLRVEAVRLLSLNRFQCHLLPSSWS